MLNVAFPIALAFAAGISIVIQQALNANLRTALDSAAWSGFVSYFVGVLCMALLAIALRDPIPSASVVSRIPGGHGAAISLAQSSSAWRSIWSRSLARPRSFRF